MAIVKKLVGQTIVNFTKTGWVAALPTPLVSPALYGAACLSKGKDGRVMCGLLLFVRME